MTLRPPRVITDLGESLCDDDACTTLIYSRALGDALWLLRTRAEEAERKGDHATGRQLRSEFQKTKANAKAAALAATRQTDEPKGDDMCTCRQKQQDAANREREARAQMIRDSANAHLAPAPVSAADEPKLDTAGMTAEMIARAEMIRSSRNAHRTGKA